MSGESLLSSRGFRHSLLGRANPEAKQQAALLRLRLRAAGALASLRAPVRTVRRLLARHRLDPVSLSASRPAAAARKSGWAVRQAVATVPGAAATWDRLRPTLYRPLLRVVPVDRLLMGGRNGMSAAEFARKMGDPLYASTRLIDSPLVEILRQYDAEGPAMLSDDRLRDTSYVARARRFLEIDGSYLGVTDEEGLIEVAREFVDWYRGVPTSPRGGRGTPNALPYVRAVRDSDCFAIVDGHHRLAAAAVSGATEVEVVVGPGSTSTPLQDLLVEMSWLGGRRELYQPIDAPELSTWPLVRRCDDRLAMARSFLESRGWLPSQSGGSPRYLDVGSCYGWFVAEMGALGFQAMGVEADPRADQLGQLVFGLRPGQVSIGEASEFVRAVEEPIEVVSCFSVLHHFVLGRGPCSAAELMQLLSAATSQVLFFDTGEAHEVWMKRVLPTWNPEHIREWILAHSTFREVVALGTDRDGGRPPYAGNYGRTLFACVQ